MGPGEWVLKMGETIAFAHTRNSRPGARSCGREQG